MIGALLLAFQALMAGASIGTVLGGISLITWIEIAVALIKAEPMVVEAFAKVHPILEKLIDDMRDGHSPNVAASRAHQAAYVRGTQPIGGGGGL